MEASSEDEKLSLSSLFNAGAVKQVLIGVAVLVSASGFAEKLPRFLESPSGNLADIAIDAIVFALASSSLAKSFGIIGGVDYSALDVASTNPHWRSRPASGPRPERCRRALRMENS